MKKIWGASNWVRNRAEVVIMMLVFGFFLIRTERIIFEL